MVTRSSFTLLSMLTALTLVALLGGCSSQSSAPGAGGSSESVAPTEGFTGKWETKDNNGKVVALFLERDGTGAVDQTPLTWTQDGSDASLTMQSGSRTYGYRASLRDGSITLSQDGDSTPPKPWARAANSTIPSKDSVAGKWRSSQDTFQFTSDGVLNIDGRRVGRYLLTDLGQLSAVSDAGQEKRLGYLKVSGGGLIWHTYENQGEEIALTRE